MQMKIACIDASEVHQLIDEPRQSLGTSQGGSQDVIRCPMVALCLDSTHGCLYDSNRGAELMGDMGEEVDTELHQLLVHLDLLFQEEALTTISEEDAANHTYNNKV